MERYFKYFKMEVPILAQWVTNATSIHEDVGLIPGLAEWVKNPVLLCRLKMQLGFLLAVAVAQASSYSSNLTPSLGTSIRLRYSPKKQK